MATRTSQLIVELLDRVSGPARRASDALRGMGRAAGAPSKITDSLSRAMDRNNAALDKARGGVLDAVGAYYTLSAAIGAPVRAAMEFESAMADVKKVVDFGSPEEIKAFEKGLMDMTKRVPLAVNGLAEIAAAAGQAGIAKEDILEFTEAAAKIGVAFDISAGEAGDAMAKLMTGLGLTLPEVVSLSDAMNHLSNAQASSAAEVLDVVRRVGAQGKQYGFTAEQVAAFGSAMISAGAQSDVASTSFMNMGRALTRGASATKRQKAAYKALGMDAEKVSADMQKDATKTTILVMEAIAALPKEMQAAISSDLFGDEARALGPLLTNLDLLRESLGLVGDESKYSGSAMKEFAARAATFQNRMQLFSNTMTRLKVTLGNALLPILTDMMDRLEPVIDMVGEWITANPDLVAGIVAATAALIAFKGAMAALTFVGLLGKGGALHMLSFGMKTVGVVGLQMFGAARAAVALQVALGAMAGGQTIGVLAKLGIGLRAAVMAIPGMGMLASAIGLVGSALKGLALLLLGNPIGLAITAIAASAYLIYRNWDTVGPWFSRLWEGVKTYFSGFADFVAGVFTLDLGRAVSGLGSMWDGLKSIWGTLWDGLSFNIRYAWENVIKPVTDKLGLTEHISGAWKAFQSVISSVLDAISGAFEAMWWVVSPIIDALKWVSANAASLGESVRGIGSKVTGWFSGEADGASSGQTGTGVDGQKARGGPISRGGTYQVGEHGPELITPTRSGYVHTASQTAGAGSGSTVNLGGIVIHAAPGMDARDVADLVMRRIEESVGSSLRGVQADTGMEAY